MSQCQRTSVLDETYTVVVRFPKPLSETCKVCCMRSFVCFLVLAFLFVAFGLVWVLIYSQKPPGMALDTLSIRNMTVYQTNTTRGGTQWQVDSAFDMGLSTWNPNIVAGCFTAFRRVKVRVEYRNQTILLHEELLGFSLKPRRSRLVEMTVEEENFVLADENFVKPVLQEELRSGNVTLGVFFSARYLRTGRKPGLVGFGCVVMVTSPSNSSSSLLLQKLCH